MLNETARDIAKYADNKKRGFDNSANGCVRTLKAMKFYIEGIKKDRFDVFYFFDVRTDESAVIRDLTDALDEYYSKRERTAKITVFWLRFTACGQLSKEEAIERKELPNGVRLSIFNMNEQSEGEMKTLLESGNLKNLYRGWKVLQNDPEALEQAVDTIVQAVAESSGKKILDDDTQYTFIAGFAALMFAANLLNIGYQIPD